jgi:hypothetical protein
MLSRLIYASKETDFIGYKDLSDIRQASSRNNTEQGITGLLLFGSGWFLQVLEGDRAVVSGTFHRIAQDPRHCQFLILDMGEIAERAFQEWAMNFVMLDLPTVDKFSSTLQRFGVSRNFQPFDLSAPSALLLLTEMGRRLGSVAPHATREAVEAG